MIKKLSTPPEDKDLKSPEVSNTPTMPLHLEDLDLESFFSDEEDGISEVENITSVIKRVGKKAAVLIEGINTCQSRMDANQNLIKQYLMEGKRPNLDFKRQVQPIAEEFIKITNLSINTPNAEQVFGQAQ